MARSFLRRWPEVQAKFIKPQDSKRFLASDYNTISHWFQLYWDQKKKYRVADSDIWNLDEKGVIQGIARKSRVIIPKYKKNPHTTQSGNREWVTSTECISLLGRKLASWTIFKGIVQQKKWHQKMQALGLSDSGYHICTSKNGWTDNELGLKKHFDPQSAQYQEGEYRILIVDGHGSHTTTDAIRFCIDNKIILLCLLSSLYSLILHLISFRSHYLKYPEYLCYRQL
jgi:hypothetical protein